MAVAPRITSVSDLTPIATQDNTTIFCQAEGSPAPSVVWYHNSSKLIESTHVTIENAATNGLIVTSRIVISMAIVNDTGNYTCIFSSLIPAYNFVSSTITIYVQGMLKYFIYNSPH